ncbi:uncharacterized protein LOC112568675 isoform X9 [Pomacea canaliculata]|uniref:uncharacterized protein LOC112568675 isoform X9 n=1 Tax=Pomacea canaliculata TaxID=400727 RepID=UPI000D73F377|nr:uncharacterized protein LOC112568675 isoform X9 [Pomacea canaliculata]
MLSDKVNLTFFILWTSASLGKAQSPSCSYVTDSKKWTLTGVCTVTNKDERGWCQMREPFKTYTDVIGNFTSVELSNSGDYVWTCSAGLELPSSNGSYNYEVRFGEILPVWRPAFTVRIHDPGQPILKNCPEQVTEAESVTCECSSERDGEPRPVLSWSGHTDSSILRLYDVTVNETYSCEMYWGNQTRTVTYSLLVTRSRGGNAQNETANGNEGERTSKKSDSSTSSPGQAAGNGSKSGGSTPRSSSSGSDKPSTNPNYTSTALQEVEIHPYMDLHTRDPTYASTTSSKDPHMYMELKTLKALQPGSEKNGNDGYETPQVPGQANKSSDGYETPQPPREGRRRSATYANQGVPADPIQEEVNYYNEA